MSHAEPEDLSIDYDGSKITVVCLRCEASGGRWNVLRPEYLDEFLEEHECVRTHEENSDSV